LLLDDKIIQALTSDNRMSAPDAHIDGTVEEQINYLHRIDKRAFRLMTAPVRVPYALKVYESIKAAAMSVFAPIKRRI
jgi:hypothetical protein